MVRLATIATYIGFAVGSASVARAHCEIPCGIYGDKMRIAMLLEDIATVEKSMTSITALSAGAQPNWNQLVRWVQNKETHADKIQETVTQYFMTQRIKVPAGNGKASKPAYQERLGLLHELLVAAMKMKQTTDVGHTQRARALVLRFAKAYFGAADLAHLREHHGLR